MIDNMNLISMFRKIPVVLPLNGSMSHWKVDILNRHEISPLV